MYLRQRILKCKANVADINIHIVNVPYVMVNGCIFSTKVL